MLSRWLPSSASVVKKSLKRTLRQGAIASVLGAIVGLTYGSQAGVPRPEGLLWTFTVDQCVDDSYEPQIQRVGDEAEELSDKSEHRCTGKVRTIAPKSWAGAIASPISAPPSSDTEEAATLGVTIVERDSQVTDLHIQALAESGTVQFKYGRSGNCCSQIQLLPKREGQVLEVMERDTADQQCRCLCDYEAEGTIDNLEPGEYTLRLLTLRTEPVGEGNNRRWVKREVLLFEGQVEL
ncbi:MAG: hypothetical protein ACFCBU_04580 [Cyanophyceae cyanobacterium]